MLLVWGYAPPGIIRLTFISIRDRSLRCIFGELDPVKGKVGKPRPVMKGKPFTTEATSMSLSNLVVGLIWIT